MAGKDVQFKYAYLLHTARSAVGRMLQLPEKKWGPKRISRSGSKAQWKGDTKNHVL